MYSKSEKEVSMLRTLRMLDELDVKPLYPIYEKIYFWSYTVSLSEYFEQRGSITVNQKKALFRMIEKHTGYTMSDEVIVHDALFTREGGEVDTKNYNRVEHDYGKLEVIQLYDLPFENNEVVDITVFPYNSYHMVFKYSGIAYKIPKPNTWDDIDTVTTIKCLYRRTKKKGFLIKVEERSINEL
jgi:hypothetical protein